MTGSAEGMDVVRAAGAHEVLHHTNDAIADEVCGT